MRVLHACDDDPAELAGSCGTYQAGFAPATSSCRRSQRPPTFPVDSSQPRQSCVTWSPIPVLPDELLPAQWPGAALRTAYNDFAAELVARRDDAELMEVK